eukprot:12416322-Karenia_brevis.AAC.1
MLADPDASAADDVGRRERVLHMAAQMQLGPYMPRQQGPEEREMARAGVGQPEAYANERGTVQTARRGGRRLLW